MMTHMERSEQSAQCGTTPTFAPFGTFRTADTIGTITQARRDGACVVDDLPNIEHRLDQGGWLSPGEVAALLGIGRTTVHRLLLSGKIGYRLKGAGPQRLCNPADVRRLLDQARREHRGGTPGSAAEQG